MFDLVSYHWLCLIWSLTFGDVSVCPLLLKEFELVPYCSTCLSWPLILDDG